MRILETLNCEVDLLCTMKTNKGKEHIEKFSGLNISLSLNSFEEFYTSVAINLNTWQEIYDKLDVSSLSHYESLHIMGGLLFPQSGISKFGNRCDNLLQSNGQIKWTSNAKHIMNILAIYKASIIYNIPLHEFCYDTDELSCDLLGGPTPPIYFKYHLYATSNLSRLDSLQYFLSKYTEFLSDREKIYDFTFGYTVFPNGNRPSYIQYVDDISKKFKNINLYCKNAITKEDNSISRDDYLQKIANSKYTLIIPSYDNTCFSLYRFIESVYNDCLPLIHPECSIAEISKLYDVNLIQLIRTEVFTESERLSILKELKEKLLKPTHFFLK